ncbi:MAG: sulfur carrier protein ThiS adenylyltransferase [Candidatus Petromonas sp.]|jgi:sulfur carrier protein ThiS adenylyltransferase|nr:sulfur carrier protein ThiS adenylyltransferase [Candidatus Petromonas sp.]
MKIFVNERTTIVKEGTTAFDVRNSFKKDADIVVLNGFIISDDIALKENDKLTLIKRGEVPTKEELESLMIARHTPGVHEKINKAFVGIVGLGGLGSNIAVSLARLGIGKLLLVDFDVVEPSNLNRQQYFVKHIGMLKTDAMKEIISEINPFVKVDTKNVFIDENNITDILANVDIVVEAFDNPKSKATLINTLLQKMPQKYIVGASGMAGYFSNNTIVTKKVRNNFYLIGDGISEAKPGCGLMAPRVSIAAGHQANTVLRIIMEERDV